MAQTSGSKMRNVAIAAALVLAVVALRTWHVDQQLLAFVDWIRGAGATGVVAFVVAYVLACVFFVPAVLFTLGAGFAYGPLQGTLVVWLAASIGATVAFVLGRTVARDAIAARVAGNAKFAAIDRAVGEQGFKIVLLTRLSPAFPFTLLNYAYGLTRVGLRDYVAGSVIGMVPGTAMYVYIGSLVTSVSALGGDRPSGGVAQQVFYFVGLAATVLVTVVVTRVARRALAQATGTADESTTAAAASAKAPAPLMAPPHDPGAPLVRPADAHNEALLAQVHPPAWTNPTPAGRYNLVVVGGGTAGLVSAAGAAGLGAKVAIVERALLGGDCLNVGCVPSKALLAAARAAQDARDAGRFGVRAGEVRVDFAAVMERMRRLRAQIAPNDGVEKLRKLGVDVFLGQGRFTGPTTVEVDGTRLEFARAVIATGARAAAPAIPGLADAGYLTNETVFWLTDLPARLVVIGAGPIGCEMAQAFRRFGAAVTLLSDTPHILPREDAEAAAIVERRLVAEGVQLVTSTEIQKVERRGADTVVHYTVAGQPHAVAADRILVAAGRAPNTEDLGLDAAGVRYDHHGVTVNDQLQTSNPKVFAAGDVASRFKFTHTADALARIVIQNALFFGRKKASALTVPWATYTSPEIAHTGLYEADARARGLDTTTVTLPFHDLDRALLDGEEDGFAKVLLRKGSDEILGATIVAAHAGDMISELTLAITAKVGLGKIAAVIHPYPTQAEVLKKAGDAFNRTRLTPTVKKLFTWLLGVRR